MTPQDLAAIAYAELRVTISDPAPTKMLASTRIRPIISPEAKNDDCWTDYRIGRDDGLEADPTPALGWRAMQTAAAGLMQSASTKCRENFTYPAKTKEQRDWQTGAIIHAFAATAILDLPGPTDAQLLAEAVKLPEVQELVKASKWVGFAAQTSGGTAGRDLALIAAIDVLAAALAKIGGAA